MKMQYIIRLRELGIIPKATVIFFVLTLGLISFTGSAYAVDISTCQTLTQDGATYVQVNNIIAEVDCIFITGDNITYDGNGFSITGDSDCSFGDESGDVAITVTGDNVLIQDVTLEFWRNGVAFEADNTVLTDSSLTCITKYGGAFDGGTNSFFINNFCDNCQNGVHMAGGSNSNGNTISGNEFKNSNHQQTHLHNGNNNNELFNNNYIDNTANEILDEGGSNNVWTDNYYTTYDEESEGCFDTNNDDICDSPKDGEGNEDASAHVTPRPLSSTPPTPPSPPPEPPQPPGETQSSDPTTPVLDSAELISEVYNLGWTQPPTTLLAPEGGYDIFINGDDTDEEYRTTSLQTQIGNLDTSVTNCFGVQARWTQTSPSAFPESNEICVPPGETPATVPDAPTNLAATPVSSSEVDLTWSAPSNDGGESITGYKIEVKIGNDPWSTLDANAGTSTSYSDTGLPSDTTCTYRISAINSMGTSVPSTEISATTPPSEEPQPPGETQSSDPTTPVLDSAELISEVYNLGWKQPPTTLVAPEGGYDIFINGVDTNKKYRTTSLQTQIGNLDTSIEQCFNTQARWTQTGNYPVSNEICVPPMESTTPPTATTVTLTVEAFDFSGNSLGQWNVLRLDGTIIGTGYTPESYKIVPGTEYNLHIANYKQYSFDRWETGSTNSHRTFSITSDTTFTAFFQVN